MIKRRNTQQRNIILEAVRSRCDHPDAEAIYNQVSKQNPNISLATVYRNLSVLASEGQIKHIKLPDADRFDFMTEDHYHFICEKCGRLFDIPIKYNKELDKRVENGFVINSHQTLFKGLCPECANNKKEDKYMELKGSKTEANLWKAFAGESQARNKYTYFASKARKEGYEQIAALFEETAANEKEHAKLWFKALNGIGTTQENLLAAAEGEHEEWTEMYKEMSATAKEEGFVALADAFAAVAKIEKSHEERYMKLHENLENNEVFKKTDGTVYVWYCRNCGHLEYGTEAPEVCPVCGHPQAYFEIKANNY